MSCHSSVVGRHTESRSSTSEGAADQQCWRWFGLRKIERERTCDVVFVAVMMIFDPDTVDLIHSDNAYDGGDDPKKGGHEDPR